MYSRIIETKIDVVTEGELTIEYQTLVNKAKEQVLKAYAPYSGFHVGAALMLANGEVFAGSNQENAAYPSGLCAERVAMFYANAQYPNVPVKAIAIAAYTAEQFLSSPITPCGACRQVLLESEMRFDNDIEVILYGTDEIYILKNIRQLMPLCFEKSSLNK
ncbi:MAG: cytidine deaminase [Paludibacter sp.]|jgi:cytidine deaminase